MPRPAPPAAAGLFRGDAVAIDACSGATSPWPRAARQLGRSKAISVGVVLISVLALGAAGPVVTVGYRAFVKVLPFKGASRLYGLVGMNRALLPDLARSPVLRAASLLSVGTLVATDAGGEPLQAAAVTSGFFALIGNPPVVGRPCDPKGDRWADQPVALVSERFWLRELGATKIDALPPLILSGHAFTIIGIMGASADFPAGTDAWLCGGAGDAVLSTAAQQAGGTSASYPHVIAALADGVLPADAKRRLDDLLSPAHSSASDSRRSGVRPHVVLVPIEHYVVSGRRDLFTALVLSSVVLLLIAAVSAGGLHLGAVLGRQSELYTAVALGARLRDLYWPWLRADGLLFPAIAAGGAAAGEVLTPLARRLAPPQIPGIQQLRPDYGLFVILLVTWLMLLCVWRLCAVLHAMRAARRRLTTAEPRAIESRGPATALELVTSVQIAGAVALCICAGLFVLHAREIGHVDPGYSMHGLTAQMQIGDAEGTSAVATRVQEKIEREYPGSAVAFSSYLPLAGVPPELVPVQHEATPGAGSGGVYQVIEVSRNYFSMLDVHALRGGLTVDDHSSIVVSAAFGAREFPGVSVLGRELRLQHAAPGHIVGVVPDLRLLSLTDQPIPTVYVPLGVTGTKSLAMIVQSGPRSSPVQPDDLRRVLLSADPRASILRIDDAARVRADSYARLTFLAELVSTGSLLAIAIGSVGVFALATLASRARAHDAAVMDAVGAPLWRRAAFLLRSTERPLVVGSLAGCVAAKVAGGWLSTQVYGLDAPRWPDFALAAAGVALLGVGAALIALIPTLRQDTVATLREV